LRLKKHKTDYRYHNVEIST